jgi:hypothetical protein
VNDNYYSTYLIDENGEERFTVLNEIDLKTNTEFKDFKRLYPT